MKIQPLLHSDITHLKELQPPEWNDITPHIRFYIDSPYCNPIKILSGNKITGIGTTLKHRDSAWLAHIIVHPEFRNKGIGKKITDTLVKSLDRRTYKTIYLIATELGYPVYLKSGFEIEAEYADFDAEPGLPDYKISSYIIPFNENHRSEILKLDKFVTGENRESRLNEHFQSSYVYFSEGKVSGAYFPKFGEGLVIAYEEEAGIELIKLRLGKMKNAIFPKDNKVAFEFYSRGSFKFDKYSKRMRLGKKKKIHLENMYNRVSGQIG
jgi:GNAT superfamily N-acetyltransferase